MAASEICIGFANVAGGRMVDENDRYLPDDRTETFGRAIATLRPGLLVVTELNCDGDQLERLGAAAVGRSERIQHAWSESHIPGVDSLGVGIVSAFPVEELDRIDLPDPPFPMVHPGSGKRLPWHPKGFLVARVDCGPELGRIDVIAGQAAPIHRSRGADGQLYSYHSGPGQEYGAELARHLRVELAARGVRRAVIVGDLNMPEPAEVFGRVIGDRPLVDGFGADPPQTTPDGRSIDRIFLTDDLAARATGVVRLDGADHFPCACRIGPRTGGGPAGTGRQRQLAGERPAHLRTGRPPGHGPRGRG